MLDAATATRLDHALCRGEPLTAIDEALLRATLAVTRHRLSRAEIAIANRVARRERDRLIQQLDQALGACGSLRSRAAAILAVANAYATAGWREDRRHVVMPARLTGTPQGLLWSAFKISPRFPSCRRAIENIIKTSSGH